MNFLERVVLCSVRFNKILVFRLREDQAILCTSVLSQESLTSLFISCRIIGLDSCRGHQVKPIKSLRLDARDHHGSISAPRMPQQKEFWRQIQSIKQLSVVLLNPSLGCLRGLMWRFTCRSCAQSQIHVVNAHDSILFGEWHKEIEK